MGRIERRRRKSLDEFREVLSMLISISRPSSPRFPLFRFAVWPTFGAVLLFAFNSAAAESVDFTRDVRPILSEFCFQCHGPDEKQREADLRLDTKEGAHAVIELNDSAASELIRRITSEDPDERMPPPDSQRDLTAQQVAALKTWVDQGADWGRHWAFAPITKPPVPEVALVEGALLHNPIDHFVQALLRDRDLEPSREASRPTLIRRLTLDLTGLPPTPKEVEAFAHDKSPDAYEKVVDRLLKSPAYGERMAWNWLDAARYADSNGYQGDAERTMWPWRDWVVDSFNNNMPYDQFTVWQLAGDLLPEASEEQKLATGFCRNHMINGEGGRIAEENRVDYVMDMSETMGTIWLGLTLNCCRCHDHKFDNLKQREYYQLTDFFNQTPVNGGGGNPQTPPVIAVAGSDQTAELKQLKIKLVAAQAHLQKTRLQKTDKTDCDTQEAVKQAQQDIDDLRNTFPKVMVMADMPNRRETYLLERGLYNKRGETVQPDVPVALPPLPKGVKRNRLALANWLVSEAHPLTARVTVNRFWRQLFGMGLVKTAGDFGVQGEVPQHLELLDWLASDFRENGWNVKRLVKTMVLSHTYRQTSNHRPELTSADPENRLLGRSPRYRLHSWMIRDQALAASGLLVRTQGGPGVNGYQPIGVWEETTFGKKKYKQQHGDALYRRSLYTFWRRIVAPTIFFDNASRQMCTVKVFRTNTPLHALYTLNDITFVEAARALSQKAILEGGDDDLQRLQFIYQRLLARRPAEKEQRILFAGLKRTRKQFQEDPEAAKRLLGVGESAPDENLDAVQHASWTSLCLALLNLDETLSRQ